MAKEIEARLKLSAIDRTKKAFDSVSRNLDRVDKKSRQVANAERGMARADRMNRMGAAAAVTEQRMIGLGRAVAVLATGAGAQKFISTSADFESALTGIQKKAGTTADETTRLGKEALALSTSGELAVPLEEILSAMERGAAAGLPLDDLREFARLSAMAGDAFEMSAEEVGNAAAGFKVSMGITMEGMEEYFGLINKLADSGIADERDIVAFLDRAGANMKLFGLTAEQAAAYAATLANIKMEPETAARMMNTLTSKLLSPGSDKAAGALEDMVGNLSEFQELLKSDGNKAIEVFLDKVGELDKFEAAEGLTGFLGQGFADEVLRLSAAREELARNQRIAADRASWKGSLGESYDLKLDDFWSRWQLLKNEVQRLTIDVGMSGMPALKSGLEGVRSLVQEIGHGLDAFRMEIDAEALDAAGDALSELADRIGDLLNMDTEGAALTTFFREMATAVNDISAGIEATATGLDAIIKATNDPFGLKAADSETPGDEQWRTFSGESVDGAPKGFGPVVREGSVADTALGAVSGAWDWAEERNRVARQPSPEDEWTGWTQPGPIVIPDHSAEGSSGWRGGGFDEGRFGDEGDEGAVAVEGIDALREAMEVGGQSVAQGGQQAGEGIAQGGAQLAAQGDAVGAAIRGAADYIAAQIRAALQTPVKVSMPSAGAIKATAPSGRDLGTTMPEAGQ
jgi:TP901 family phage tail tape measure protein